MTSINGTLCFYALLLTAHASFGAEPAEAKPDWVIRTIQLPLELDEFVETGGMALRTLPDLPASSATKDEWEAYLKRSNDAMVPVLKIQGIPMPDGSAALYDAKTGTLSVRNTAPSVELVESYVDSLLSQARRSFDLSLEVLEASEGQVRGVLKEAQTRPDHTELYAGLKVAAAKDNAAVRNVCALRLATSSSQWAWAEDAVMTPEAHHGGQPEGLAFQAKPVLQPDGSTVELEYKLQYGPRAEKAKEWKGSRAAGAVFESSIKFKDGATKLLGVWRAPPSDGTAGDRMRLAFLKTRTTMLVREPNPLVESKLRELVGAPPQEKPRDAVREKKPLPAGMELRVFPVPRDFLASGSMAMDRNGDLHLNAGALMAPKTPAPADPFAPAPSGAEVVDLTLHNSAKLSFPEGCSAIYVRADSTLWIVHNAEGLKRIEKFLNGLWRQVPRTVVFSVEVVEADSATLLKLSEIARDTEGHARAREMLEKLVEGQQARVVEHHRLETLSGRRGQVSCLNARTGAFEFEMQATLAADERALDAEMTLAQGKGVGTNVTSHIRMAAGVPRLVAVWKPGDEGEGDKEVLRAAFVRAEVVPVEKPVGIKTPAKADDGTPAVK